MKNSIRILSAALAPVLVGASLVACNTADPTTPPDTEPPVTQAATQQETSPVTDPVTEAETQDNHPVIDGMELTSDVKIYCPFDRNRTLKKLASSLAERIQEKTGLSLSITYDGKGADPADSEIILGYDENRGAAVNAYNNTAVGGYSIYTQDNDTVLAAWDEEDLEAAANLFLDTCLVQEGDAWFIRSEAVASDRTDTAVALSAYRLVYDADIPEMPSLVENLQAYMLNTYGVRLEAVDDNSEPLGYEMILGKTNRVTDKVRPYLEGDSALQDTQRAIVPDGDALFILGDSAGSIALAFSRLLDGVETHFIGQGNVLHALGPLSLATVSETYVSEPLVTTDRAETVEGTDIRIMSYNILNQDYVPDNPLPPERDEQFTDILLYYMPDVVGIQEANAAWHESFDMLLGLSGVYLPACKYHEGESTAQTTFLYNPLTVQLIDEYVVHYSDGVNDIRIVSIAVFETIAEGKRFVMTNTHPAPHAGTYEKHIDELIRIKTEELAKYAGLPIIMTGDFNTRENSSQYTKIMESLGVMDAKYDAEELVRNIRTYTPLPSGEAIHGSIVECGGNSIDHIFINDKVDSKLFNVVIDHNVTNISDHLPIYADLILK